MFNHLQTDASESSFFPANSTNVWNSRRLQSPAHSSVVLPVCVCQPAHTFANRDNFSEFHAFAPLMAQTGRPGSTSKPYGALQAHLFPTGLP